MPRAISAEKSAARRHGRPKIALPITPLLCATWNCTAMFAPELSSLTLTSEPLIPRVGSALMTLPPARGSTGARSASSESAAPAAAGHRACPPRSRPASRAPPHQRAIRALRLTQQRVALTRRVHLDKSTARIHEQAAIGSCFGRRATMRACSAFLAPRRPGRRRRARHGSYRAVRGGGPQDLRRRRRVARGRGGRAGVRTLRRGRRGRPRRGRPVSRAHRAASDLRRARGRARRAAAARGRRLGRDVTCARARAPARRGAARRRARAPTRGALLWRLKRAARVEHVEEARRSAAAAR